MLCIYIYIYNRPFYRYGDHIELIRFKEYYRMPWGMSTFRLYFRALSQNKIVMGIKILVPCLDVIMIAFFWFSFETIVFHCIFLGKRYAGGLLYLSEETNIALKSQDRWQPRKRKRVVIYKQLFPASSLPVGRGASGNFPAKN